MQPQHSCSALAPGSVPRRRVRRVAGMVQVKSPMTMTEKILAKHADRARVAPGENIWTNVDKLLTHDVCGPGTFGIFQKEFGEDAQVCRNSGISDWH